MFILATNFSLAGYADSSAVQPNEPGVVHDAKVVYRYVRKHCASSPLFVWGHSLGTGSVWVATSCTLSYIYLYYMKHILTIILF